MEKSNTIILAFVGKGGVGKTSLSAAAVRLLSKAYPDKRILAIDADPAVGLATALGTDASLTVDDIRKAFVAQAKKGNTGAAVELLGEAKYRMFDAVAENGNVSFLAIGRPEGAGCYCKVNAYLKEIISMLAGNYDYVVIDGEAGIEHVNRRVMEKVTHLLLISDASRKGLQVIKTIHAVAKEMVMFEKAGVIINRIPDMSLAENLDAGATEILSLIPDDSGVAMNDATGESIYSLPESSPLMQGAKEALVKLGVIQGN
ncbi:MAG: AAA family ATPase [Clostridia bacterium]|nr:AAA family ATPase [Clostridia bacterium]